MKTPARLALLDRILSAALAAAIAAVGLFWSAGARADDIDIYSLRNVEGMRPNVLIILDNSANWSASLKGLPKCDVAAANVASKDDDTKFGKEKCALYKVISSLSVGDLSQFNFALMLFNESPDDSGYPRKAFIQVTSQADKQVLLNLIAGLDIGADKTNNPSSATTFYEAYRWFTGGTVYLGNKTATKHDVHAFTSSAKTTYVSPGLGCARNHIIYLANGSPKDNDNKALTLLQTACPERHSNEHSGGRKRQGHRCVQLDRRVCGLLLQRRRPRQCDGRRAEHHDAYDRGDRRVQRRQLSELHPLDRQAGWRPLSRGAEQRPGHPGVYQDPEPDPRVE